ncbi:MAG: hypothetical protein LBN26_03320 [Christensenellaceae bacterium]|jgi:hypothetical protein|nr:hypothetical protein [Christensenellaceae bacterium]
MNTYSSEELQNISSDFRATARRLSRTDYSQCDANLKRFIAFIDSNPFTNTFISENNTKPYDVPEILKARGWLDPFEVSPVITEEISFEYQLLKYAIENFDGDFTRLYSTRHYVKAKSTANDEMHTFIEHIVDPLIDYIAEHIRKAYERAHQEESQSKTEMPQALTATNSTIVFNSKVGGDIATTVNLQSETRDSAQEIIKQMAELLDSTNIDNSDEILEILESINDNIKDNQKPKKGFLTALKSLCSGTTAMAGLATALIKLLTA